MARLDVHGLAVQLSQGVPRVGSLQVVDLPAVGVGSLGIAGQRVVGVAPQLQLCDRDRRRPATPIAGRLQVVARSGPRCRSAAGS